MSEKIARNKTVKRVPFCKSTVNKVVKEKFIYGDVVDGASPKTRLGQFDKLSLEMKDKIRHTVSLLPFRFYVKSILVILKLQNLPF